MIKALLMFLVITSIICISLNLLWLFGITSRPNETVECARWVYASLALMIAAPLASAGVFGL